MTTNDTKSETAKPFCRLKHQMNAWLPSVFIAGAEFLILWGQVLLSLYGKSQPIVPCSGSVCPSQGFVLALVLSMVISILFIAIAILAIQELMESKAYRREIYLFTTLGGIAGAINFYYLVSDMVLPLIMKFYEFEKGMSPPAIVMGIFITAGLIYLVVWAACELEERQERIEKAKKDIAAQEAANHPQE